MSDSTISTGVGAPRRAKNPYLVLKVLTSAAIISFAIAFVWKYVFRYYLNYNQAAFTDPLRGAADYWVLRGWLLMHMTGGMIALLTGPWQFWTGFRVRYARLHRWTGRFFLAGVTIGCVGAIRMASATTFGWAFGLGLVALAFAWATTSGMAYFAIRKHQIAIHKEWMARAYVVTFAFVTFRILTDYYPAGHLQPLSERMDSFIWVSWVIPLLILEVILQLRRMRSPASSR